ncbi:MAG: MotA/TolQ/ExbB proton channel family protein [Planctomycetota bacterium]
MSWLQDALLQVSTALLVPVLALLLVLLAGSFVALGAFLRELRDRRRDGSGVVRDIVPVLAAATADPAEQHRRLAALEARLTRRIDRGALASRLGPILGLAGTLIPLGPALRELGGSDLTAFADKIVVAFTTTVAGLAVCAIHYGVASVRARWYEDDLRVIEGLVGGVDDAR